MSSFLNPQTSFRDHNEWMPHLERLLSASCIGWCLQASFKENPKSTTLAYAGGVSGVYAADFFLNPRASGPPKKRLLRAGGFLSFVGISWCLNTAFEKHPQAAIRACLAGALSMCLGKAVIYGDPLAPWEEARRPKPPVRRIPDVSEMYYSYAPFHVRQQKNAEEVGKKLNEISKEFHAAKLGSVK